MLIHVNYSILQYTESKWVRVTSSNSALWYANSCLWIICDHVSVELKEDTGAFLYIKYQHSRMDFFFSIIWWNQCKYFNIFFLHSKRLSFSPLEVNTPLFGDHGCGNRNHEKKIKHRSDIFRLELEELF